MLDWLKGVFMFGVLCASVAVAGDDDDVGPTSWSDSYRSCTSSESSDAVVPTGSSFALFRLVNEGDVEGLRAEVAAGADVDYMLGSIRRTPLHGAARLGRTQMVRMLLGLGAEVEIVDCNGRTALDLAEEKGHQDVVDILRGVERAEAGVMTATMVDTSEEEAQFFVLPDEVLMLVLTKLSAADLARVAKVCTRLRGLVMHGFVQGLRSERGEQGIIVNREQAGPTEGTQEDPEQRLLRLLRVCLEETCPVGVEWLLRSGEDVIRRFGSAEASAAEETHEPDSESFVDQVKDTDDRTLLLAAACAENIDLMRLLIEYGADVDQIVDVGHTILCWAVVHGHEAIVELLLERGADRTACPSGSLTLLDAAQERGYLNIVDMLQGVEATIDDGASVDGFEHRDLGDDAGSRFGGSERNSL